MTLRHRLHRVIYVPLDDRPVNAQRPHLLAQMVDYELLTPPRALLGCYRTPGRPDEIAQWLVAQVSGSRVADCLILSLDMLVYGGLVASRTSDIALGEAANRLEIVAEIKNTASGIPIYASSMILRAVGDTNSAQWPDSRARLEEYSRLAAEAEATGTESDELHKLRSDMPEPLLRRYQQVRQRNHQVNLLAIDELAAGHIDFLVLPQDDAGPEGLHKLEQARLQERIEEASVGDRAMIYPGADEVGMTLFARFVHKHMEKQPAVKVEYVDAEARRRIAPYEDRSVEETIAAQIAVVGGSVTEDANDADLVLLVNPPAEPGDEQRAEQIRNSLEMIKEVASRKGVAICDVADANGADDGLVTALLDSGLEPAQLLAFAGWNTAANSIGSALAHSTLRLIARQDKGAFDLAHLFTSFAPMRYLQLLNSLINTERAHAQLLFLSMVDDWLYQTRLRPELKRELQEMVAGAELDLSELYPCTEEVVRDRLAEAAADLWMNHFWGKRCVEVGSGENRNSIVLAELEETRVRLPWRRLFEVSVAFNINVELVADK